MKKIFYATKNKYKINNMKDRLSYDNIEVVTPYEFDISIDIEENGKNVIENALIKAKAYYGKVDMPIIAGDSALFIDKFDNQPGLFVRRINGSYLTDEELEKYYIEKLIKAGGESRAFYKTGLAIITCNDTITKEIVEDSFILKADGFKGKRSDDPLGRIEYDTTINKFFCELTEDDKKTRNYIFDTECRNFIIQNI